MTDLTVVFDLDGTLVDTAPDLIDTLNVVLVNEGLPPIEYAKARTMIGGGARRMIEAGLTLEGRTAAPSEIERMLQDFITHYAAHVADRSRAFPGLDDALVADAHGHEGHRAVLERDGRVDDHVE